MARAMRRLFMVSKNSIRCACRWRAGRPRPAATLLHGARGGGRGRPSLHRISCSSDGGQRLLNALLERLVRRDCGFRKSDGFKAGFHFKVECEGSVVRGVRGISHVETLASGPVGTGALDNRPGLSEFAGEFENAANLVAA